LTMPWSRIPICIIPLPYPQRLTTKWFDPPMLTCRILFAPVGCPSQFGEILNQKDIYIVLTLGSCETLMPHGSPPLAKPAGYLILPTFAGDFGAFGSDTISQLATVPDHGATVQLFSVTALNARSVRTVIPGGSTDPPGGGGGGGGAALTVRVTLPTLVSLVALICAVPAASEVTRPDDETVATAVLLELQAMT